MEIPGLETFVKDIIGEVPQVIAIPYKVLSTEELLRQAWNKLNIAIIPYCFKCREPLTWHSPMIDNIAFHCPKCGRKWVLQDKDDKRGKNG